MRRIATLLLGVAALSAPVRAGAQESHFNVDLGAGHAVGQPQQSEYGFGGEAALGYELRFAKIIGIQATVDVYDLAQGSPPSDPTLARHGQGFGVDGTLGIRLHPFGTLAPAGLWLDASGGIGEAGSAARAIFEANLGYDFHVADPSWDLGPFVGYTQVFQPSDTLRPQDGHVLWVGLHVDLGLRGTPRVRPDRDQDTVYDDEDACPDVPGVRTSDPKTNGCPPPDRDGDGIPDSDDACPDVPGVKSSDPAKNGCPPDRDGDGIRDPDDACPDVPGVHTDDPKTNGCPPASDAVHVEGDQILLSDVIHFETGSPHVHHASWDIIKKVADYINHTPDIEEVDIQGHADEVGTSEYNLYLSKERAAAVRLLLVHFGVDPKKVVEHAYGKDRPREAGHDERAHRENRRVEFTITRAREGNTPAQPLAPQAQPNGGT